MLACSEYKLPPDIVDQASYLGVFQSISSPVERNLSRTQARMLTVSEINAHAISNSGGVSAGSMDSVEPINF